MTLTTDEKFIAIEKELNRLAEQLAEIATVDDAVGYSEEHDELFLELKRRTKSLEQQVLILQRMLEVAKES